MKSLFRGEFILYLGFRKGEFMRRRRGERVFFCYVGEVRLDLFVLRLVLNFFYVGFWVFCLGVWFWEDKMWEER